MFFVLSKVGWFFVQPSNVLIASAVVGLLLTRTRFAQLGLRAMAWAVALLAVCAILPVGNWILLPLEERFPPWNESQSGPDGIIVLGGAINSETSAERPYPGINSGVERISATSRLAKRYPQARIVYAGTEAETAAQVLEDFGIPRVRVELAQTRRPRFGERARPAAAGRARLYMVVSVPPRQRHSSWQSRRALPRPRDDFRAADDHVRVRDHLVT
jgi:hypothetical protein